MVAAELGLERGLQVAARVKRRAGSGQDRAAHLGVGLGAIQGCDKLLAHLVAVGVARVGAVERDDGENAGLVEANVLRGIGHARIRPGRPGFCEGSLTFDQNLCRADP